MDKIMRKTKKVKNLLDFSFDFELLEKCPLCDGEVLLPNGKLIGSRWIFGMWYVENADSNL